MNSTQQTQNVSGNQAGLGAVHLLLTEGELRVIVEAPERVMEQIHQRAEQVSSVLEGILRESHGHSRWGLNE